MTRLIILASLLALGQITYGQDERILRDDVLFEKGLVLQELVYEDLDLQEIISTSDHSEGEKEIAEDVKETILDKAHEYYQELIDSFPKSKLLFRALNNLALIEADLGKNEDAKNTYKKILDSEAEDKEPGGVGSGLMADPYANYKNRAAKALARIYIEDKNYVEAIKSLDLTKKYPYLHFCGNEYAADEIYMSTLYAKCYLGLNNNKKALEVLLPNLIENGLVDNSYIADLAYKVLLKQYPKKELKKKYEQAFKNYQTERKKGKTSDYETYYIVFVGTKIVLNSWSIDMSSSSDPSKVIESMYKRSKFYSLVNN
jgi:tetratricopeptide (TPR) repeat protein